MATAATTASPRNPGVWAVTRTITPINASMAPKMVSLRSRFRRRSSALTRNSYCSEFGKTSGGSSDIGRSYSGSNGVGLAPAFFLEDGLAVLALPVGTERAGDADAVALEAAALLDALG